MMTWEHIANRLVGAPFRWGGRGPQAFDCWGLVREARRLAGLPLPPDWDVAEGDLAGACALIAAQAQASAWQRREPAQDGDVVVLSTAGPVHHVGVWLPWGVLHAVPRRGAVLTPPARLQRMGYSRIEAYQWVG